MGGCWDLTIGNIVEASHFVLNICTPLNEVNYAKKMVSHNLRQAHILEVGLTKIMGDHEILSIVRHVGLHVDFSYMKSSLGI